jgi:hypothetical protein
LMEVLAELEGACLIEDVSIGMHDSIRGKTLPGTDRVLSSGRAAVAPLEYLSRSPNPAARVAAGVGLSRLSAPEARALLERLAADKAWVQVHSHDSISVYRVSDTIAFLKTRATEAPHR